LSLSYCILANGSPHAVRKVLVICRQQQRMSEPVARDKITRTGPKNEDVWCGYLDHHTPCAMCSKSLVFEQIQCTSQLEHAGSPL
jgi:hypothetical protein